MVYLKGTLHISKLENAVNAGDANLRPRLRHHAFVSGNSHENFPVGHPSWDCSCANSLNFGVPMESEASELSKGLVLGSDENIHIRLTRPTPLVMWDLTLFLSVLEYFLSENSFPDSSNYVAYYIRHCIHFLSDFI